MATVFGTWEGEFLPGRSSAASYRVGLEVGECMSIQACGWSAGETGSFLSLLSGLQNE